MANPSQAKGQLVYAYPDIWPDCPIDVPTDLVMATGEVYGVPTAATPVAYGIAPHNHADNDTGAMWMKGHYVVRKKAGTAWVWGDRITFAAIGGTEVMEADVSATTDLIHGIVMRASASADTTGIILFLGIPPFGVEP